MSPTSKKSIFQQWVTLDLLFYIFLYLDLQLAFYHYYQKVLWQTLAKLAQGNPLSGNKLETCRPCVVHTDKRKLPWCCHSKNLKFRELDIKPAYDFLSNRIMLYINCFQMLMKLGVQETTISQYYLLSPFQTS